MASTSRQNNNTHTIRYDVFLSFRGEDTRDNFTVHLYKALDRAGLRTFRDNDEIHRGEELELEIETAIIESSASIIVLSENYVKSRWCLNELCLILEQRKKRNHFVLPIFYHVNPSDVRKHRRSFAIEGGSIWAEISKCLGIEPKEESKWEMWKAALTKVANLAGMELSGSEIEFIEKVVNEVKSQLDLKQLSIPDHLTGMEARVGVINSMLKNEKYNAIAICGMGGSGKTTLAQYIYSLNRQDFEGSSFIEVSREHPYDPLRLQKQLLKDVLGGRETSISSVPEGRHKIEEVLKHKRLLIVLDDIGKLEQLHDLLGTKTFPTQSKLIITTIFLTIDAWFGSINWKCWVYELTLLNKHESLKLLSWHAFQSKTPMKGFKKLAVQLSGYCGGNPLALEVLGSSLVVTSERKNKMIDIWESRLKSLKSLKGNLDSNIQGVLQKSYDTLPLPNDKELFLYIACFFVGESVKTLEMILEDELNAKSGIFTLTQRCLLTNSSDGKLMMHQLLQEMGRRIVCEEDKDPAKRSRVWHDEESYNVLKKGDGSAKIEGLALDKRKIEHITGSETLTLKTSSFAKMDKLIFLQLKYVKLTGSYENFPELIWLCWHRCSLQTMPSRLLMSSLVAIDMRDGHLKKFDARKVLNSLKYLNLKGCDKLVRVCNLHQLPKLESLILLNCSSLTHLCRSIRDLSRLVLLDLGGCTKLWMHVNPETPLFSLPQSLMHLDLTKCDMEFSNNIYMALHGQSSINLVLAFNPFDYLPNNINVKVIRILNLNSCTNLKSLPCIPSTLKQLYIDWCTSLERITFQSGRFSLREFSYERCVKLSEIQGLFKLVSVAKIDKEDLGHMHWIKAYEDQKVDLVGDDITKGKTWHTQMLYEYGIMSTFLQGVKDQIMTTYEYTSSSSVLSFRVPCHPEENRIKGLNVSCLYRSSISQDKDRWLLLAKISNITKGLTWIYNPVVYYKPTVDADVVWLSYWPIGNILDDGDKVHVEIICENGMMIVSGCSGSLVYMDSEVEEDEKCENNSMEDEEVIGGDLSDFEVTKGGYYLCRRALFGSETSKWLNKLFGENVRYPDSQGWRKTHQSMQYLAHRNSRNTFLKRIE